MRKSYYIEGYDERLNRACLATGMTKNEIAEYCGFNRKNLYPTHNMMGGGYLARFCAVTGTDANWLLGIRQEQKKDIMQDAKDKIKAELSNEYDVSDSIRVFDVYEIINKYLG